MAFAQFHNQSSVLKINLMVVDDDPVFLEIMSRMLENSKYRVIDPYVMEVTVIAAKDSKEALSTLKVQRNNIDLIITDYYMPGMNGLQLKKRITEEFGHFPVIVISADADIEQESLTSGALCFLPKPIKPCDLPKIYESALICKRNGKSTLLTGNNLKDNVPQNTQLLPEQAKVMKTKKKIGSFVRTDGSRKNRKSVNVDIDADDDDDASPSEPKKRKITWTDDLHDLFLRAIRHIGLDKAVPKNIVEYMNIPYLTRENVASHLQKYRMFLKKVSAQSLQCTSMESIYSHGQMREPYLNYLTPSTSWYDSSLNNRAFYTKPGDGFGQSRLLSITREPVRFNKMASYSIMNRSTTYEPNLRGSNVTLPINSNLSFSNQPSQNEGSTSLFQPSVMETNNTHQTYQVLGNGQHKPSAVNCNDPNSSVMGNFGSFTPYQAGPSHFSYGMRFFSNSENAAYNPQPQSNATIQPYNPEPHTSANPEPHTNSTIQPYNLEPHTTATMQPHNPEPHTNSTIQPYNFEPHTTATMQPHNPEPHTNSTIQPYNLEPHTNATMQPYNPEPHASTMQSYNLKPLTNASMQPYNHETHAGEAMQAYNPEPHTSTMQPHTLEPYTSNMQPYNPEPLTNAAMQPYNPESLTNAVMQPYYPEPHANAAMQQYNLEPLTNAAMQPFNPEPHTNETIQPYNYVSHTNTTIQPNLELPQMENLSIYDELGMINEVSCNISNFHFDNQVQANLCEQQQQVEEVNTNFELPANFAGANSNFELPANICEEQQGEGANTNFEPPANIATELNEIISLDDNAFWTFLNTNQGHSNEETLNALSTLEMNPPVSSMNPNQNETLSLEDNIDWTFVNTNQGPSNALTPPEMNLPVSNMNPNQNQELVDDFLNSLFNDNMN